MSLTQEQRDSLIARAGRAGNTVAAGINLLATQNTAQTAAIASLQNDLATLTGRVSTTESRADAAELRLNGHDTDIAAVFTAITGQADGADTTDADDNGTADVDQSGSNMQQA
jgi:hypothetical protein